MLGRITRTSRARYKVCCQLLQRRCSELKNKWWTTKAAELQSLADSGDPKGFYQSMRAVWGPRVNHPDQLLALDNKTLLTEKSDLLARWKDHFSTLLNEPSTVDQHVVDNIEQRPIEHSMSKCPDLD